MISSRMLSQHAYGFTYGQSYYFSFGYFGAQKCMQEPS